MARKMTEWPSKRGPITKIMPSDGCIGDTVPLAVGKWYEFHEFGWYMGNVGLKLLRKEVTKRSRMTPNHICRTTLFHRDGLKNLSHLFIMEKNMTVGKKIRTGRLHILSA